MYKNHTPLTINVISDIHYYAKSVGIVGPEFEKANGKSAFDLLHNEEILDALANQVIADKSSDIVLISGDLTNNGEPDSHKGAVKFMQKLKDGGKQVYMISATHDYQDGDKTTAFTETGSITIDTPPRDELWNIYYDFGPKQAIATHRKSMSYVVQLADGYRLFALNDDSNWENSSGFSEELFAWIEEQVKDARKNGQYIVPMTHHPMISPSPFYYIIGASNMMGDCTKRCHQFADMGIPWMLTGHTHIQDISYCYSDKGNIFYDITTAAPVGYPGTYRKLVIDPAKGQIDVKAVKITEKPNFEMKGETIEQHLEQKFFGMIRDVIEAAGNDTKKLARMVTAFSVDPKLIFRIGWIIKPFAKILGKLKIGTVAKWCKKETGLKKEDYRNIANERVVDFIISLVSNLYGGDSPYTPDTAYYKITMGICSILDSILGVFGVKISKLVKGFNSVSEIVEPLLYNKGICDAEAILPLYPLYDENNPAPKREEPKEPEKTVKKSKKGLGIIISAVLLVLVFLPLILLWLALGFIINQIKYRKELHKKD